MATPLPSDKTDIRSITLGNSPHPEPVVVSSGGHSIESPPQSTASVAERVAITSLSLGAAATAETKRSGEATPASLSGRASNVTTEVGDATKGVVQELQVRELGLEGDDQAVELKMDAAEDKLSRSFEDNAKRTYSPADIAKKVREKVAEQGVHSPPSNWSALKWFAAAIITFAIGIALIVGSGGAALPIALGMALVLTAPSMLAYANALWDVSFSTPNAGSTQAKVESSLDNKKYMEYMSKKFDTELIGPLLRNTREKDESFMQRLREEEAKNKKFDKNEIFSELFSKDPHLYELFTDRENPKKTNEEKEAIENEINQRLKDIHGYHLRPSFLDMKNKRLQDEMDRKLHQPAPQSTPAQISPGVD